MTWEPELKSSGCKAPRRLNRRQASPAGWKGRRLVDKVQRGCKVGGELTCQDISLVQQLSLCLKRIQHVRVEQTQVRQGQLLMQLQLQGGPCNAHSPSPSLSMAQHRLCCSHPQAPACWTTKLPFSLLVSSILDVPSAPMMSKPSRM